jgi:hypothetical protein
MPATEIAFPPEVRGSLKRVVPHVQLAKTELPTVPRTWLQMRRKRGRGRSYAHISSADLAKLADIARVDRKDFFTHRPDYRARLLMVALCQGAALHYVDESNGIKDFDVRTFYAQEPGKRPYHPLRHTTADFGRSKFGNAGTIGLVGRNVDLLGRTIEDVGDSVESVRKWLKKGKPKSSAWYLAKKAVIVLEPAKLRGCVVWPQ